MRVREKILLQVFYLSASFHCYVAVQSLSELLDYCAANIGSNRDVPDLSCAELEIVSSISQVQLLMRHGARIPWTAAQCWGSYNVSWTGCDVYVLETPMAVGEPLARMQFKKVYDGSDNEIHGTCQLGQLLHDGFSQARVIGQLLRQHYIGPDAFHIFPSADWDDVDHSSVYFQSDDEERTLLTTQAFVTAFFNASSPTVVSFHTGDDVSPIVECPGLQNVASEAYSSGSFINYNETVGNTLTRDGDAVFGNGLWSYRNIFDCLMTTACTDRPLPEMGSDFLNRIVNYSEEVNAFKYQYRSAIYAKMFSGPILGAVAGRLRSALTSDNAIKFSVRGMHDSDISGILSILLGDKWNRRWPPYASTLIIELYRGSIHDPYFMNRSLVRVVYNGAVLNLSCAISYGNPKISTSLCYEHDFLNLISITPSTMDLCKVSSTSVYFPIFSTETSQSAASAIVAILIFCCGILTGLVIVRYFFTRGFDRGFSFDNMEYRGIEMESAERGSHDCDI